MARRPVIPEPRLTQVEEDVAHEPVRPKDAEPEPVRLEVAEEVLRLNAPKGKIGVPNRPSFEMKSHRPELEEFVVEELEPEDEWGAEKGRGRPTPWGLFVLIGLLLVGGVGWSIHRVMMASDELDIIRYEVDTIMISELEAEEEARAMIARIENAVRNYGAATTVEERLQFSRHPERVRSMMEDHDSRYPFETFEVEEFIHLRPLVFGYFGGFWMVTATLTDGERRNIIVEVEGEKGALVDWETAVCYQPMDWDDFARNRPAGSLMDFRVYVEQDDFYSHEFSDSTVWNGYKLTARDGEEVLFGYVRADSPSADFLRQWFARFPGRRAMMILALGVPEGLESPRGVVIDHAKSSRWIYVQPPLME